MSSGRSFIKRASYNLTQLLARLVAVSLFSIRVHGRDRVPSTGGVLVCSNHQSYLDPVLVGLAVDRRLNYLARQTLFDNWAFGWLIRWYDAIPIQRDGMGLSGIKETLRRLRRGEMVLIFPEGTRTEDGDVLPLKGGFCALARRGNVPLLPVGIDGAYQVWPRTRRLPRPRAIQICIGSPIEPDDYREMADEQLIDGLAERIRLCRGEAKALRHRQIGLDVKNLTLA